MKEIKRSTFRTVGHMPAVANDTIPVHNVQPSSCSKYEATSSLLLASAMAH